MHYIRRHTDSNDIMCGDDSNRLECLHGATTAAEVQLGNPGIAVGDARF